MRNKEHEAARTNPHKTFMKNTRTIVFFTLGGVVLIVLAMLILARFSPTPGDRDSTQMTISSSIYPLSFLAHEIAGEHARVLTLTPAGVEPHDYELTPQDIGTMSKSALVIMNGAGLEPWGDSIGSILQESGTRTLVIGDLPFRDMKSDGYSDPHFWLSPPLMREIANAIAHEIIRIDPAHESDYRVRLATLDQKLSTLDTEFRSTLAVCTRRDLVTAHDAFGHLASEYLLSPLPIAGLSPELEPSPRQLVEITELVRSRGVKVIFFEALVSPKLAETLAAETGTRTLMLDPLEGLDAESVAKGEDYFSAMRMNLKNLSIALECAQ
jgi:zinc transport system substrate-binding protein